MEIIEKKLPAGTVPYINRDLSWLSFNYRVLLEAKDKRLPLYERIKFLAIYSSNLDEYYRVRVASIQSLLRLKKKKRKKLGLEPGELLETINAEVLRQQKVFGKIFRGEILPELEENGIQLIRGIPVDLPTRRYIRDLFEQEILPYVHPEILLKRKVVYFLRDQALYMALRLSDKHDEEGGEKDMSIVNDKGKLYAMVLIPTHYFTRFVRLPEENGIYRIMFLDDVLRANLDLVFPGLNVEACYCVKLSRDAHLEIEDEFEGNLVDKIRKNLSKRKVGAPSRFLYDQEMPAEMLRYIRNTYDLRKEETIPGATYHNFMDLFEFPNPGSSELEAERWVPLPHNGIERHYSFFDAINQRDRILHFPYQSYDYILRFLNEAAFDPGVEEIMTTQYRVASNSAIVNSLINAAINGKKVRVFVELKARFDEENNLRLAYAMEEAGVEVIYSMPGLKVHAKVALIRRREEGKLRNYGIFSTGNFNEKTAKVYADHTLLTSDSRLTDELVYVFDYLGDKSPPPGPFEHLLVAQFNLKEAVLAKIDREIAHARAGRAARMIVKLNNLEEKDVIDKLYEASRAGVQIEMIVRAICCLRPGVEGLSENIRITRIVDRYLEHARLYVFHNNGKREIFSGSADWMDRNLNRRVEVIFPVYDRDIQEELMRFIDIQLADCTKAVWLDEHLHNIPKKYNPENPVRAQLATYEWLRGKSEEEE